MITNAILFEKRNDGNFINVNIKVIAYKVNVIQL